MNHKNLSESDLCDKVIRPAIVQAGWHALDQIYAQFPLRAGRVVVRGQTARRDAATVLFADFVLCHKPNIPLAVVEAKKSRLSMSAGLQQAIRYADLLEVPFSFSSNGVPHISTKQVGGLAFALPPLPEQSRIVTRVAQLRRLCFELRQRLSASQSTQAQLAEALVENVA